MYKIYPAIRSVYIRENTNSHKYYNATSDLFVPRIINREHNVRLNAQYFYGDEKKATRGK